MQESAVQCCTALTWAWDLGSGSVGRSSYRFQKFQIWHVIFSLTVIERRDNVNARSFLCKGLWYAMNSPSKSTCSVAQEIAKEDKRRYYLRVCIVCMIFRYLYIYIYLFEYKYVYVENSAYVEQHAYCTKKGRNAKATPNALAFVLVLPMRQGPCTSYEPIC